MKRTVKHTGMVYNSSQLYPKDIFGLTLYFTTRAEERFASTNWLWRPYGVVYFKGTKPYEEAMALFKKDYDHDALSEETEKFYSDAVIQSIGFYGMDTMYQPRPAGR